MVMVVVTVASVASAQDDDDTMKASEAIIAQETAFLNAWASGNPLGHLSGFADDMTYFDDIGASDLLDGKRAIESYFGTLVGKIAPHHYEMVDPNVQLYDNVGILTLHYRGWMEDGTVLPLWKATSVYHKTGDDWRVVHAHWSLVKSAPAAEGN